MNFHVGQRVVCVDDQPHPGGPKRVPVRKGKVYTVAGVDVSRGLFLEEVKATYQFMGYGFYPERFRPVVERKTDISQFQAMLTGKKVEVTA